MNESAPYGRTRSTLSDVAQLAGVSPTTASLVLTGKAGKRRISEETHGKVRQAAESLGYIPSLLHRSMQRGRTHVVSFYNGFRNREWSDLYMDRLSAAIEHAGGSVGYDVLVHCNFNRNPRETYEFLNGGLADGLIFFAPSESDPLLPMLRNSALPTVLINRRDAEGVLSSVQDDEEAGMRIVADAILDQGHTKLAAVMARSAEIPDASDRVQMLRRNLAQHGVELPAGNVLRAEEPATETLTKLLALPQRPTVVFVWHDLVAYALLEACDAMGVKVPDDLSIVGYDGLVWPSTSRHIANSVHVPLDTLARTAMHVLDRLIAGEGGPIDETISVSYHPGTTLGPPAR